MTCKHETRKKNKRLEYVGHLHFAASTYDLNSIPDNETAMSDAAAIMPFVRIAALFLNQSDKALTRTIRDDGDLDRWVDLLEQMSRATTHKKQEYDLLNAGYVRLQVVLERVVGKRTMERVYS